MVFALTIVAVCLLWMVECGCCRPCMPGSYPHASCRSASYGLVRPWPDVPRRYSFGWVHWAVAMSACILAIATVLPVGEYRHRLRGDVRTPGVPHLGGGYRILGINERTLG